VCLQGSNRSNSMGFGAASTIIHCPSRGAGSGGATRSLCLTLYVIMFIKLCFNFMSLFAYLSLMWSVTFFISHLWFKLCKSCGHSSEKLMLNGGFRVCSLLSLVLYPKRVYFTSLTLTAEYWGSGRHIPLNKTITIT
jgi:hypothetical protein